VGNYGGGLDTLVVKKLGFRGGNRPMQVGGGHIDIIKPPGGGVQNLGHKKK